LKDLWKIFFELGHFQVSMGVNEHLHPPEARPELDEKNR
jgi:hypothetical protein